MWGNHEKEKENHSKFCRYQLQIVLGKSREEGELWEGGGMELYLKSKSVPELGMVVHVFSALRGQRQVGLWELKASLVYVASSRPARAS